MTRISDHDLQKWLADNPDLRAPVEVVVQRPEPSRAKAYRTAHPYVPTEAQEQRALFDWAAWKAGEYPELALLTHVPNEANRGDIGHAVAVGLGLRVGFPDLVLPVARGIYHSLAIELKRADRSNQPTPEQWHWLEALRLQGWKAEVCYGFDEAREVIEGYLRGES